MFDDLLNKEKVLREIAEKENIVLSTRIYDNNSFDDSLELEYIVSDNDIE